jgi:hypothetical protein
VSNHEYAGGWWGRLGVVVHVFNPNYIGCRDGMIVVCGRPKPKTKKSKSLSLKTSWTLVVHTCNSSYTGSRGECDMRQAEAKA